MVPITSHVWRPPMNNGQPRGAALRLDRLCEYMNCRRPRAEHERHAGRRMP